MTETLQGIFARMDPNAALIRKKRGDETPGPLIQKAHQRDRDDADYGADAEVFGRIKLVAFIFCSEHHDRDGRGGGRTDQNR